MGQANCSNGFVVAAVAGEVDVERLQRALGRAQERHPFLRARVVRKGMGLFLEAEASPNPIVVQHRPLPRWREELEREIDSPFPVSVSPLFRSFCFSGPGPTTVVALVYSHAVCDGLASISLLGKLLQDAMRDGAEPERCSLEFRPPIEQLAPPPSAGMGPRFLVRRVGDWLRLGVPQRLTGFRDITFQRREVRILSDRLDAAASAALLARCRAENTTVNGALAAALLLAIKGELPTGHAHTLALSSPVNLRPKTTPLIGSDEVGNYIGHVVTVHRVGSPIGFWELARTFNAELRRYVDEGYGQATWLALPPSRAPLTLRAWSRLLCGLLAIHPPAAMLSNVGRLNEVDLGEHAQLQALSFGLSPIFRDALALCVSSFQGELAWNLVHSTRALAPEAARRIGECIRKTLVVMAGSE